MDIETREDSPGVLRPLVGTAGVLMCHFLAFAVLSWALISVMQGFVSFCNECNLIVPDVTRFTFSLSRWLQVNWYLLMLALVPDGIIYFFVTHRSHKRNWLASLWLAAPLMATIALLALAIAAIFLPLHALSPNRNAPDPLPLRGQMP